MGIINPTIPGTSTRRNTGEVAITNTLNTIVTLVNGSIDGANGPALRTHYRNMVKGFFKLTSGLPAAIYVTPSMTAANMVSGSASTLDAPKIVPTVANDHTTTGLTTSLRVRGILLTNPTAPGINYTYGLYPVSTFLDSGGGTATGDNCVLTVGTVVSGSTVTRTAPGASSTFIDASADFSVPADGNYILGVSTSGVASGNAIVAITIILQVRNV